MMKKRLFFLLFVLLGVSSCKEKKKHEPEQITVRYEAEWKEKKSMDTVLVDLNYLDDNFQKRTERTTLPWRKEVKIQKRLGIEIGVVQKVNLGKTLVVGPDIIYRVYIDNELLLEDPRNGIDLRWNGKKWGKYIDVTWYN